MEPWAPAHSPQPRERPAARGSWAEGLPSAPAPLRRHLLHAGQAPRPGSWHGRHGPDQCVVLFSRQGYEDPHWQYPAAGNSDGYSYQSHQWQPVAWQDDRDVRQGESHGKSYRDQHYYRGYHPNLATAEPPSLPGGRKSAVSLASEPGWCALPPLQPSLLLQYQESGLSSSSHELSQYIRDGADDYSPGMGGKQGNKWLLHTALCFGAGGHLVLVCPHHPAERQLPRVELHSLEAILHGTEELEELQAFPGPLAREDLHKVDVMTFCQQKINTGCDLSTQRGRDSSLLWKLLVLLCRQNGSMVGSDAAELLMQDCRRQDRYRRQEPAANLLGMADDEWAQRQPLDLITGELPPVVETQAQIVEKFTKLLYYGRKKEALVWAMRNHLWGHALFLSSKMDPRTYSWVLTGFTSTLATNDPLQTLFQLMSGRIPQAALCCGDATWGDWRPHLAVMLSNKVGDTELNHRAIVTMGDTLASKGAVEAAHFCYLMADVPFGYFGAKADRMALLGSSHRQAFSQFARTEAIQRMEIFEYCQQLRQPESFLLPFQVYKLLYASRLADHGLPAQALQYCELVATALLRRDPAAHPVLARQVVRLAERLKLCDPLLLEMPEQEQALEPDWLEQLRACCQEWEVRRGSGTAALCCALSAGPGNEIPQSESYQYDQWFEPVPSQGLRPQEDMSLRSPAPAQVAASPLPSIGRDLQPPVLSQETPAPLAGGGAEPPPQPALHHEPHAPSPVPGIMVPTPSRHLASTPSYPFPLFSFISQSSGFRWFGWFRSKPTKETSPKAESDTGSDSPTSGPQVGDKKPSCPCPLLTSPLCVSQLPARPTQPRLLSRHRYPNPL
uniref:Protein transport protein sec16 n=1 Tax=Zonotrichia albicollis TaxID=44394 RepID=A0A8D2MLX9_ZONAL